MAHLLVTGGAGFIGANFVQHWRLAHPADRVVVFDALTPAGNLANLDGVDGIALVHGDICSDALVRDVLREFAIDTIVNFAAECDDDHVGCEDDNAFVPTNVLGTYTLLGEAKAAWLDEGGGRPHRFHQVSTEEACASLAPADPARPERHHHAPISPYAASKAAADHLVRAYHQAFGLQVTTSYGAGTFGPRQAPDKLIPSFIINALEGRTLPIDRNCMIMRDWIHVDDHCRGVDFALSNGRIGAGYHLHGATGLATFALVDLLCGAVDDAFAADAALRDRFPRAPAAQGEPTAVLKRFVAGRSPQHRHHARDRALIDDQTACQPAATFETHLRATLRWYLHNEWWWRAIRARVSAIAPVGIASQAA